MVNPLIKLLPYLVPDVVSEKVEEVVHRLSEVASTEEVLKMDLDATERCTEGHCGDLDEALLVDDHGGAGAKVEVVDLQPDLTIAVERNESENVTSEVVDSVSL